MDPRAQGVPQRPSAPMQQLNGQSHNNSKFGDKRKMVKTAIIGLAVIALLALAAGATAFGLTASSEQRSIAGDKYQAVFLTNGQVYFGKISKIDESHVSLNDIFYLQQQSQEPQEQGEQAAANTDDTNTSLAKLGSELHGPEDVMFINKEQVLFWENLKTDGKVSQAIADYKKQ